MSQITDRRAAVAIMRRRSSLPITEDKKPRCGSRRLGFFIALQRLVTNHVSARSRDNCAHADALTIVCRTFGRVAGRKWIWPRQPRALATIGGGPIEGIWQLADFLGGIEDVLLAPWANQADERPDQAATVQRLGLSPAQCRRALLPKSRANFMQRTLDSRD
jgi:hypothetical protein